MPVRSAYPSSTPVCSKSGTRAAMSAKISRLIRPTIARGTGTKSACGQSRFAVAVGIPARTPNLRTAYDAEVTTPRDSALPPTTSSAARPAVSGHSLIAHWTNIASTSTCRMRRGTMAER